MDAAELLKLAKKEKLDELESAWMNSVGEAPDELGPLLEVPEVLAERGHDDLAESLLWYLVDSLTERGEPERALDVCRRGGRLLPGSSVMRDLLADLYARVHGESGEVADLVRLTLRAGDLPLDEALAALQNMMALKPGSYVWDPQRGTVGRVEGPDTERGGLLVTIGEAQKLYGPSLVGRLEPVAEDDFRALSVFERERLVALAQNDPEDLVRIVLTSLDRRMALRRLRLYLEPLVGPWSKWWSRAREALKRSAAIGMTAGRSPSLFLRARPLSHGERLLRKFDSIEQPVARLSMALDIAREAEAHGQVEPEAIRHVADGVGAVAARAGAQSPLLVLAAAAVAERLARQSETLETPEVRAPGRLLEGLGDPAELVSALPDSGVLLCALDFSRRRRPQAWQDFYAAVLPLVERETCQAIARDLAAADARDALAEARREVLARPDCSAGALAWLWRDCVAGQGAEASGAADGAAVVMRLLTELAALVRSADVTDAERKERIGTLRSALFMRNGGPLRRVLEEARPEQVAAVRALGERNAALTDNMRADLLGMLRAVRPGLFTKHVPLWEEDVIYATQEGIEKRRAEVEHIAHVRLPQVMREIGQAAGFGDVSDNAEYRAALQERARLAERAARMQEELSETRMITRQMASADHVTVGSRVRARNLSSGQVEALTFLGPWDARPEDRVYAYNASLGLAFMGKRVGETVTFQVGTEERRWEIVAIEPGL